MFKHAKERRVWWPVKLTNYDEDGKHFTVEIRVLFGLMPRAEREAITQRELESLAKAAAEANANAKAAELDTMASVATDRALAQLRERAKKTDEQIAALCAHVHDWRGVVDEDGERVTYSADVLRDLLAYEDVMLAFANAYAEASRGAVAKN